MARMAVSYTARCWFKSSSRLHLACIVPMEEYDLGKIEVMSSSLIAGSIFHGRVPQRQRELFQRQYSGGSNPLTPTNFFGE